MFGYKKRIKELEDKVERLNHVIKYPPKHKVGDTVKNGKDKYIVTSVELKRCHTGFPYSYLYWEIKVTNIKTGNTSQL